MYHVQLKAEGNDHIERALPHHRVIVVRHGILQQNHCMIASLIKNPSAFLWLAAFHLLWGGLYILIKGPLRIVSSLQAASSVGF